MKTNVATLALVLALSACGSDDGGSSGGGGSPQDAGGDTSAGGTGGSGGAGGSGGTGASGGTGGADASNGCDEPCGDGVCIGGACCERIRACDDVCCGSDEVCSFGACAVIGSPCTDSEDCGDSEYCEPSLAEPGDAGGAGGSCVGTPQPEGRCLPSPPVCPAGTEPDPAGEINCVASCQLSPPTNPFDIEIKYEWGTYGGETAPPYPGDVRNAPIVIQLDDDDCDGEVTSRDIPEIVFTVSPKGSPHPAP